MTICNTNRIRQSKADEFNATDDILAFLFRQTLVSYQFNFKSDVDDDTLRHRFADWRRRNNFTTLWDIFATMGHQCRESLVLVSPPDQLGIGGNRSTSVDLCNRDQVAPSVGVTTVNPLLTKNFGLCFQIVPPRDVEASTTKASGQTTRWGA